MAHPYHWDVIGWMSDILSWRRNEVMAYYRTYYSPNNAVLVLVGDFAEAKALELIKKYFGPIPAGTPPPEVLTVEPPQMGTKRVVIKKEAQVPSFQVVWHAPGVRDPDFYAMSILGQVLLRGQSSRLYRRLVREEQLATRVSGGSGETIDPLSLHDQCSAQGPSADLARIEAVIEEELAKIKKDGLTGRRDPESPERHPERFLPGPSDHFRESRRSWPRPKSPTAASKSFSRSWTNMRP